MDSGLGKSATVLTGKIMPEYRILTKAEKAVLEAAHNYAHAHDELRNIDPDKPESDSAGAKFLAACAALKKVALSLRFGS